MVTDAKAGRHRHPLPGWAGSIILVSALGATHPALPAEFRAGPDDFQQAVDRLKPGDTLFLEPGQYLRRLDIDGLTGTPGKLITIEGAGGRPVFLANPDNDTIVIRDAGYITLRNLEIDGRGMMVNGVRSTGRFAHHIVLDDLYIHDLGRYQQIVGISSKCPAWDWRVSRNVIIRAGTGMYFGNSNGDHPFWGGVIENNLVSETLGYNLQIKHQNPRPALPGMPTGPRKTIIRRNVFSKAAGSAAGNEARPNVLVGHWPLNGPGKDDEYLIYGNFFYQNPSEALFQGEGKIALYNNLFYNSQDNEYPAVAIQPHNDIPRKVRIFFNTVLHRWKGIRVTQKEGVEEHELRIIGNAVFSDAPLQGGQSSENLVAPYADVPDYFQHPAAPIGTLSLFPKPGKLQGRPINLGTFADYLESDRDFNGQKRDGRFRGAYSAAGRNPGWKLSLARPPSR
ncbi:hypothetical protein [Methylococcus sp. EFPC2]|uniref:hypothetical protein n=1 Tax=Methylococcus sp. EFPC2 TaxID=2812648 RepID=UPI0019670B01|nr:hypothetical protein [Methylococcus sp. EFPC2]QSA98890.1 hypothetical protein JWZ97_09000 [Methylococcus sp. EFPC2]